MKYALALSACLFTGCSPQGVEYESYVQANRTAESDEAFVLVLLKNPSADPEIPDTATVNFLLRPGDTKNEVFRNKHYPQRTYTFTAFREDERVLTINIVVEDGSRPLFRSTQRFASWIGF